MIMEIVSAKIFFTWKLDKIALEFYKDSPNYSNLYHDLILQMQSSQQIKSVFVLQFICNEEELCKCTFRPFLLTKVADY